MMNEKTNNIEGKELRGRKTNLVEYFKMNEHGVQEQKRRIFK